MTRRLSLPLSALVLALVAALTLGTAGAATAGGLTAKAVKKIAAKVVDKKAAGLSVAKAKSADTATSATNAANATNAGNAAQLGGAAPSAYLDRVAHENLTANTPLLANQVQQIMNPTAIEVPAGVGLIHVTAVASFSGGNTDVAVWPSLDGTCAASGAGYNHRQLGNTAQQTSVAVDMVAAVTPGEHGVRLCAGPDAATGVSLRSMTIETVAGDSNG